MTPEYLRILGQQTPAWDKVTIIASVVVAGLVSHLNTIATVIIAVLTIGTMIPRMLMAWREWRRDRDDDPS